MRKKEKSKENAARLPLSEIGVGTRAVIEEIEEPTDVRLRLSDLGMHTGAQVMCLGASPLGDPRAYLVRGRIIAVRRRDAKNIKCKP